MKILLLNVQNQFAAAIWYIKGLVKTTIAILASLPIIYGLYFAVKNSRNGKSFLVNFLAGAILGVTSTVDKVGALLASVK
jgi:hypothetical protein